jgi:hypothetical protein
MRIVTNPAGDRFRPDEVGRLGWVLPVAAVDPGRPELIETEDPLATISTGPFVDLAASFSPARPGRWALRWGLAAVLGAIPPQYMEPEPVRVHRDVAGWLRAGCNGIVLLTGDGDEVPRVLSQIRRIDHEDAKPGIGSSSQAIQSGRPLDRRRLEGLVRKIITADRVQREGTLHWACHVLSLAAATGEIRPELARAMLIRAGIRAGFGETAVQRVVAASFQRMGGST